MPYIYITVCAKPKVDWSRIVQWDIIPAKITGFPGIIPGFSVSSRYPGISAKYGGREVQCRRRPTVGPTSLRHRADVAPTSLRRRSDIAPTSGRRRSDVAPTSGRRRSDVALTSLRIAPLSLDRTPYMYNVYACVTCYCIADDDVLVSQSHNYL